MKKKNMKLRIEKLTCENTCAYHTNKKGKLFVEEEILPDGVCPWLYNTVYPYFLGLLYGARFDFNKEGDCNVCCPATHGVDTIVRLRSNDGSFGPRIEKDTKFVIYAEIIKVNGNCPYGHREGQKIPFPTCMKMHFMCPAAFHNAFSVMKPNIPSCIDKNNLRCPDWANAISLGLR